ncbi:MAG: hypothetical protein OQK11_00725 [Thiovulaceae bacterium]|nr:hypothetical protein [Sulfurimonadaceae bacterium]
MDSVRYLFQSPYNSQVQFGRPDPTSTSEQKTQENLDSIQEVNDTTAQKAESFETVQTNEVTPKVESPFTLDVYA